MTTFKTNNPIGSTAVKDLYDNAENLDHATNDRSTRVWTDRFGVSRRTWYGMEQDFQDFLINSGYQQIGDYGPGLEITARNQVFWRDGELYRAGASLDLPYITTGEWATEESLFVAVGDQVLRQQLESPGGAEMTGTQYGTTVQEELGRITYAERHGASLDRDDNEVAIQAAFDAGYDTVYCALQGEIRVSSTINLNTDEVPGTGAYRKSRSLIFLSENAVIVPTPDFVGDVVVAHRQTIDQAAVPCFAVRPRFKLRIDGRDAPAGVHGFEISGTWQPQLELWISNMPGRGINIPARPDIEAVVSNTDDAYANLGMSARQIYIHDCGDWGYYNEMFASGISAEYLQVQNSRGGMYTCSRDVVLGGSISYNGDPNDDDYGGLRITRTPTVTNSTTGFGSYTSMEIDSNWSYNVWLESCNNTKIAQPRLISREISGKMRPEVMCRFGGGGNMSAFGNLVDLPYIRHSQHTTNPPITLFEFTSLSAGNTVHEFYELGGGSSSRSISVDMGQNNVVTRSGGRVVSQRNLLPEYEHAHARLASSITINTSLADVVFDVVPVDNNGNYNASTGEYTAPVAGIYTINSWLMFGALSSDRTVTMHLRYQDPGGAYSTIKANASFIQQNTGACELQLTRFLPAGAKIKIAAVASTGTPSQAGNYQSGLIVSRVA